MMINTIFAQAIVSAAAALVSSGVVATVAFKLKDFLSHRRRAVIVRLESGQKVELELDRHLSQEQVSELVLSAVRSAQSGDTEAIKRAIADSRAASREARAAAS